MKNESPDFDFGRAFEFLGRDSGSPSFTRTLSTRLIPDGAEGGGRHVEEFRRSVFSGEFGVLHVKSLSVESLVPLAPWSARPLLLGGVTGIAFAC